MRGRIWRDYPIDRGGTRSAALKIYIAEVYRAIDLRVDWSNTPIDALSDILSEVRNADYARFFARLPTTEYRALS